jgi:hypothetical protein
VYEAALQEPRSVDCEVEGGWQVVVMLLLVKANVYTKVWRSARQEAPTERDPACRAKLNFDT